MHTSSVYAIAAPLRRGEDFCGHHDPKKFTGVRCAGIKKHGKGPCNVWSGSLYEDAAPLRRGSPYCHHHRIRCAGYTRTGYRCTVTSSSENAHAEPLRMGKIFCMHHVGSLRKRSATRLRWRRSLKGAMIRRRKCTVMTTSSRSVVRVCMRL